MRAGIFAKTFPSESLETCLDAVATSGVRAVQFNLALVADGTLPGEIPASLAQRVRDAMAARELEMVAVSGTYNMAHPDEGVRRAGSSGLQRLIVNARALGTRVISLCTGTRDTQDMWRWHPGNASSAAWEDMLTSVRTAVQAAERHDVTLAFEPEHGTVVDGATAARRLLDEIGSPHLRVLLDAANLVLRGRLDHQKEILDRAFALLGPDLVLAHAKDVSQNGTVVPAGRGGLDYGHYVALLRDVGYRGALVLHDLRPDDVPASLAFLQRHLAAAL